MEQDSPNLFRRRDTFFGICQGIGEDFGFNPLWLRLAFVLPLFFFPVQTILGYFGLGLVVLASRLIFPSPQTMQPALTEVEMEPQAAAPVAGDEARIAIAA